MKLLASHRKRCTARRSCAGWIGELLSAGSAAFGFMQGEKARDENEKLLRLEQERLGELIDRSDGLFNQAISQSREGFARAEAAASGAGQAASRRVLEREQQMASRIRQSLLGQGLAQSSLGANLQRGLAADTNRSLEGISEGAGALRSGIIAQGTQAESNLLGQKARAGSQLGSQQAAAIGGTQFSFDPAIAGQLGVASQGLGSLLEKLFLGGGGSVGGSSLGSQDFGSLG